MNGKIPKARFVVRGFQEKVHIQSDSPTGSKECMRIVLMIAATKNWVLNSLDVTSAFLQGQPINRVVYLKPPLEAGVSGVLWRLKKCLYGLNDASRMWYFAVYEKLISLNCLRLSIDYALFIWFDDKKNLSGLIEVHVDDMIWIGTKLFAIFVIAPLCSAFQMGSRSKTEFDYLGLHVCQSQNGITLDQIEYIDSITPIVLSRQRQTAKQDFCDGSESKLFRQLVGKLNWISSQSRPDIAFDVCSLSSVMKTPKISDIVTANKILRRIKEQPLKIMFPGLTDLNDIQLVCYSDASLANLPSGRSSEGYVIFAATSSRCCPILWKSNTIKRVVRSTLAAETSAMVDALDASYFVAAVLSEVL